MADNIHDLNQNTPAKIPDGSRDETGEAKRAHRRVENEATKLAERGKDRQGKKDPDEFSNIGPV